MFILMKVKPLWLKSSTPLTRHPIIMGRINAGLMVRVLDLQVFRNKVFKLNYHDFTLVLY